MIEARCTGADGAAGLNRLIEQLQDVQHDEQCEFEAKAHGDSPLFTASRCGCYARAAIRLGYDAAYAEAARDVIGADAVNDMSTEIRALRMIANTAEAAGIEGAAHEECVTIATDALKRLGVEL